MQFGEDEAHAALPGVAGYLRGVANKPIGSAKPGRVSKKESAPVAGAGGGVSASSKKHKGAVKAVLVDSGSDQDADDDGPSAGDGGAAASLAASAPQPRQATIAALQARQRTAREAWDSGGRHYEKLADLVHDLFTLDALPMNVGVEHAVVPVRAGVCSSGKMLRC
jgi:hypothetical protein